jgi:hypothetical protein
LLKNNKASISSIELNITTAKKLFSKIHKISTGLNRLLETETKFSDLSTHLAAWIYVNESAPTLNSVFPCNDGSTTSIKVIISNNT